jgi:hypothetical protein
MFSLKSMVELRVKRWAGSILLTSFFFISSQSALRATLIAGMG